MGHGSLLLLSLVHLLPFSALLCLITVRALLGTFLRFQLLPECASFRLESLRKRSHVILLFLRFGFFPLLLFGLFSLAFDLLFCQDSSLRVSVWLSLTIIELADLFAEGLFRLNVVVSEANDFCSDLLSGLSGMVASLAFASTLGSPDISVLCLWLLFHRIGRLLRGFHATVSRFVARARVLDRILLLLVLSFLLHLPVFVSCRQFSLRRGRSGLLACFLLLLALLGVEHLLTIYFHTSLATIFRIKI